MYIVGTIIAWGCKYNHLLQVAETHQLRWRHSHDALWQANNLHLGPRSHGRDHACNGSLGLLREYLSIMGNWRSSHFHEPRVQYVRRSSVLFHRCRDE